MKVVHLFDWYLPSTLSWVGRLLFRLQEHCEISIAAPWIVQGEYLTAGMQSLVFPPQKWLFPEVQSEWQYPLGQRLFARSQRFMPLYPRWLYEKLRASPPDVFHAHYGPTGCLYLPLAEKLDRPLIVTFYGFDYRKLLVRRPVFIKKYHRLFDRAAKVIAASATGAEALEAMGCPTEKLAVVPPSPALERFPFIQNEKPSGRLNLVQAATFTPKKGHVTTLRALALALRDCPNLRLTLAGEKYDRHTVREVEIMIKTLHLQHAVDWLDFVPHAQMAAFLTRFDAFIQPSRTTSAGDHEATPVALLEAMATGLPVLATRHFDLSDQVITGYNGWLAEEGNAAELADAIKQFYQMQTFDYQVYRHNARQHVEAHYTLEKSAERLLNLYKSLF